MNPALSAKRPEHTMGVLVYSTGKVRPVLAPEDFVPHLPHPAVRERRVDRTLVARVAPTIGSQVMQDVVHRASEQFVHGVTRHCSGRGVDEARAPRQVQAVDPLTAAFRHETCLSDVVKELI